MKNLAVFLTILAAACGQVPNQGSVTGEPAPSIEVTPGVGLVEDISVSDPVTNPSDATQDSEEELTYSTSQHFGYVGDLSDPIVTCRNWIVGIEPNMSTYSVNMRWLEHAGYWDGETKLAPDTYYCDVSGTVDGVDQDIFQPQPPSGNWGYRNESYLWINLNFFPQIGCYVGAGTVLNAVTVAEDSSLTVPPNPTANGISCK